MTKKFQIFIPGGILGVNGLSKIINSCKNYSVQHFQFGLRQEIILDVPEGNVKALRDSLSQFETYMEGEEGKKFNIISSFLACGIGPNTFWLKEGMILDILDQFYTTPQVRVNITDLKQDFVYSFTGDINFVASDEINYWHVYLRKEERGNLKLFPLKIHTEDIARFTMRYEEFIKSNDPDFSEFLNILLDEYTSRGVSAGITPMIRVSEFYHYEGFHQYGNRYWLGIYMRQTAFPLDKLDVFRQVAAQQRIANVHITPWKSIIIKEIQEENLTDWKHLLAGNNISIGHSYAELNWQLNDFDNDAVQLKAYLRKELAATDSSTLGVIFGINNVPAYSFSHIIIKQKSLAELKKSYEPVSYDILYRKDFNPTINEFKVFKNNVPIDSLTRELKEAVKLYFNVAYEKLTSFTPKPISKTEPVKAGKEKLMHQCSECFTIYDPEIGEPENRIEAGTPFSELPESYCCPLCDAPKTAFKEVKKNYSELKL